MMYSTDENQKPVPPLLVNESRDGQNEEVTMMEKESFALLNEASPANKRKMDIQSPLKASSEHCLQDLAMKRRRLEEISKRVEKRLITTSICTAEQFSSKKDTFILPKPGEIFYSDGPQFEYRTDCDFEEDENCLQDEGSTKDSSSDNYTDFHRRHSDFVNSDTYEAYIGSRIAVGMKVRRCFSHVNYLIGDTGIVVDVNRQGKGKCYLNVKVDWKLSGTCWVPFGELEILDSTESHGFSLPNCHLPPVLHEHSAITHSFSPSFIHPLLLPASLNSRPPCPPPPFISPFSSFSFSKYSEQTHFIYPPLPPQQSLPPPPPPPPLDLDRSISEDSSMDISSSSDSSPSEPLFQNFESQSEEIFDQELYKANDKRGDEQILKKECKESIQRCVKSLVHACKCRDANCLLHSCRMMKGLVNHTRSCQSRTNGCCKMCKQLSFICICHAKQCNETRCCVPFCLKFREKLHQQRIEQETHNNQVAAHSTPIRQQQQDFNKEEVTGPIQQGLNEMSSFEVNERPHSPVLELQTLIEIQPPPDSPLPQMDAEAKYEILESSKNERDMTESRQTASPKKLTQESNSCVLIISPHSPKETEMVQIETVDCSDNKTPDSPNANDSDEGLYEGISDDLSTISSQEELDYEKISDGELDASFNSESPLCNARAVSMDLSEEETELLELCSCHYLDEDEVDYFLQLVSSGHLQINCISSQGDTPILSICRHYRGDNLYILLKGMLDRPDIDLEANCIGENALTLVSRHYCSYRLADCVKLLIKYGVKVETYGKHMDSNALVILSQFQCGAQLLEVARILVIHMSLDGLNSVSQKVVDVLIDRGLHHESLALYTLIQSERAALNTNRREKELLEMCSRRKLNRSDFNRLKVLAGHKKVRVDCMHPDRLTPLLLLCKHNQSKNMCHLIEPLLRKGNISFKTRDGFSALSLVCCHHESKNLLEVVRLLLRQGIRVSRTDSALIAACFNYKDESLFRIVRLLLRHGISVNNNDENQRTALFALCNNYNGENLAQIVQYLLDNGADVRATDCHGSSCLMALCKQQHLHPDFLEVLQLLLENGADPDEEDPSSGSSPLIYLCVNYKGTQLYDIVRLFIRHNAEMNKTDYNGRSCIYTLFYHYTGTDLFRIAQAMLDTYLDVNILAANQTNALWALAKKQPHHRDFLAITRLLIENAIDLQVTDPKYRSILHIVCKKYRGNDLADVVQLLVKCRIAVGAKDKDDKTAFDLLSQRGFSPLSKVVQSLIVLS